MFSHSVVSDSLRRHRLQHARPRCPSPTPRAYSNLCPSHRWCHPTISSSVIPFSSHLQSFPASECFLMSRFFAAGGQSIGFSTSASVLPVNIQDWFPLGSTGWTPCSPRDSGLSRVFSNTTVQKHQFFGSQLSIQSNSHIHIGLLEKPQLWQTFVGKVMSLLFNMLSRLVTAFLPRSKHRIYAFELWCWRRLLRVPWTARKSNQFIQRKSILNIHWKDWCWSWNSNTLATWCKELTWKDWRQEEKGPTEDEMVGRQHRLNGHKFEYWELVMDRES